MRIALTALVSILHRDFSSAFQRCQKAFGSISSIATLPSVIVAGSSELPTITKLSLIALLTFGIASQNINAQADKGNPATAGDLDLPTQFQQMVDESNRYQRFKVVPSNWLAAYKVNLTDSLAARTSRARELQSTIDQLENEVAAQSDQIAERDATIGRLNEEKDGISFLGANMPKAAYNTLVWGLVAALFAGMLFFLARGRYAVSVSRELESSNNELTTELEKSKRRRLEVEQDLRRKLQDERNKNS